MAAEPVPVDCPGRPVVYRLAAGTSLFRVHRADPSRPAGNFRDPRATPTFGGRFDVTERSLRHLYAGLSPAGAVAEYVLRDDRRPTSTVRQVPLAALADRVITEFRAPHGIDLVSLAGPDLGQVGQDVWLTKCEPSDYPLTQEWGTAIRGWCVWAHGFIWRGRLNENEFACILYRPEPADPLEPIVSTTPIDREDGLDLVRAILLEHAVTVAAA
jgi:hypothetical protein